MLIITHAMKSLLLALVFITLSLIHCQAITVRDDESIYDVSPKSYTYPISDPGKSEIGYRQDDYYKPLRRSDVRTYQYSSEDSQEVDYSQLQQKQDTENYSFPQRGREPQTRRRAATKKLQVEQYLKEVTPTTKTTYIQRSGNDIRLNGQPRDRVIKQQAEELQRGILKQQSIQYILQPDLQQKSGSAEQVQYVIAEPKSAQFQQNEQQPYAAALTAYQNALLAHQKVLETESQSRGETSRSSIFVMHSIPKKPTRKIVKPATENIEQYTRLQQQKQPIVYERQEPAEVMYQTKFQDTTEDTNFQASTEMPAYQNEKVLEYQKLRQQIQDLSQYQQISTEEPLYQEEKLIPQHSQQLAGYQQVFTGNQGKTHRFINHNQHSQISPGVNYQSPEGLLAYSTLRPKEQVPVQYQQPIYVKKGGPKYLPEPKSLRYQPPVSDETEEKYQQIVNIPSPRPEPLITYEAAIAKLQSEKLLKSGQSRLRPQGSYQQQEQDTNTVRYALPNPSESQDAPPDPEAQYIRIGKIDKYRSEGNAAAVVYRQSHQNANVRYYRRPPISYSQYQ